MSTHLQQPAAHKHLAKGDVWRAVGVVVAAINLHCHRLAINLQQQEQQQQHKSARSWRLMRVCTRLENHKKQNTHLHTITLLLHVPDTCLDESLLTWTATP